MLPILEKGEIKLRESSYNSLKLPRITSCKKKIVSEANLNNMLKEDIQEKVKKIIRDKLALNENEIQPNANFIKDLGADSLDNVELIMEF